MTLSDWLEAQPKGVLTRLARDSGLAYTTVFFVAHGGSVKTLDTARKLSDATGGAVSVEELCRQSTGPRKRTARDTSIGRHSKAASA
jgi:hypothetical protein